MVRDWVVVALSLAAALAFAASSSLKHLSAGQAPDAQSLRPGKLARFARATVGHPQWLVGIGCDVVGLGLQIAALHLGALVVVQPLLLTGLVFALVLRARLGHQRVTRAQLGWAVLLTAALAGFLLLAAAGTAARHEPADTLPAVIAGLVGGALAAACIELGRRQRQGARTAALLGVAVGITYAATAALLKALTYLGAAPLQLLTSWQLYAVLAVGVAGLLLNQLAFQAGPITASLPATSTLDPLGSIVIGVAVYDEHIRRGPGGGALLVALLVLLGAAVIQLSGTTADAAAAETAPAGPAPSTHSRRCS